MLDSELQRLKMAFRGRQKPSRWVCDNLDPLHTQLAADFVRDIESGCSRADLFQSAIRYYSLLTDEARLFLLPDYLGTLIPYPHQVLSMVCELENERGQVLFASLVPAKREAVVQFINSLSTWEDMRPYSDEVQRLAALAEASRTSRMQ